MKVHTFGDSHSVMGWNTVYIINMHYLGPRLCYSVGRDKDDLLDISKEEYKVEEGDIVIFSFGSIDCTCHVHKYITETTTYQQVIDEIIEKYFLVLIDNVRKFKKIYPCVYNIVPPVRKDECFGNDAFPFRGTDEERRQYILYFNKKLKQKCEEHQFTFFDVYDLYCDKDGFINKKLSDGNVHIDKGIYLQQFVDKLKKTILEKDLYEEIISKRIESWRSLNTSIIDDMTIDSGHLYFHKLLSETNLDINKIVHIVQENDRIGNPILHNFSNIMLCSNSLKLLYDAFLIYKNLRERKISIANLIIVNDEYLGIVVLLNKLLKELNELNKDYFVKIAHVFVYDKDYKQAVQKYYLKNFAFDFEIVFKENCDMQEILLSNNITPSVFYFDRKFIGVLE